MVNLYRCVISFFLFLFLGNLADWNGPHWSIGKNNKCLSVCVDYHTKWLQAYPLTSMRAEEVTEQMLKCVHQFAAPKIILTDQGREFVNAVSFFFFFYVDIFIV